MAVEQNLLVCMLISAMAGLLTIAGKAIVVCWARTPKGTSVSDQTTGMSRVRVRLVIVGFASANILANLCIFVAPWFGPISIYWPTYVASQLVSNMLIVGRLMQDEVMDKASQVATLVIVAAVLYITLSGPAEPQLDQNVEELIWENPLALAWILGLLGIFLGSFLSMLCLWIRRYRKRKCSDANLCGPSQTLTETVIFLVSCSCSTLCATTSKVASLLDTNGTEGLYRWLLIAITWIVIICWSLENFVEGSCVRSLARFLPFVTFGSIILNAATGLIVWQDYKVVSSWMGYVTALFLLGIGVYLISDLDFFQAQLKDQQDLYLQQSSQWMRDLFTDLQDDLCQAKVEMQLNPHQLKMLDHTRREQEEADEGLDAISLPMTVLNRGVSDPEVGTRLSSRISLKRPPSTLCQEDREAPSAPKHGQLSPVSEKLEMDRLGTRSFRSGRSSSRATLRTLESIDLLAQTLRDRPTEDDANSRFAKRRLQRLRSSEKTPSLAGTYITAESSFVDDLSLRSARSFSQVTVTSSSGSNSPTEAPVAFGPPPPPPSTPGSTTLSSFTDEKTPPSVFGRKRSLASKRAANRYSSALKHPSDLSVPTFSED